MVHHHRGNPHRERGIHEAAARRGPRRPCEEEEEDHVEATSREESWCREVDQSEEANDPILNGRK